MEKHITTPLTDEKVRELHAGDYVYLSMRLLVVGPADPITCPSLAGDGPR